MMKRLGNVRASETVDDHGESGPAPIGGRFRIVVAVALVLAELGVLVTLMTPTALTLSLRIAEVFPDSKSAPLSVVLSVGALFGGLSGPFFGALSDRTTLRIGRRRPYLIAGLLGAPLGLLLMGLGEELWLIAVGWCSVQLMMSAAKTVILTGVHDFVPPSYRARVSAFMGMTATLAPMVGAWIVQFVPQSGVGMFLLPFVPAAGVVIWLLVVMPDQPAQDDPERPVLTPLGFLRSLWINPLRYPDFGFAALNRFLVNIGFATFLGYQTYTVMDRLGLAREQAARVVAISTTIIAISVLISAAPAGWVSDRIGRRKIFVAAAGVLLGLGLLAIGLAGSVSQFLIAASVAGIGYGLYQAIDLALVASTLPSSEQAATGMGFSSAMAVVPHSLAPALAPALLGLGERQNYTLLFAVAAVVTILGCLAVIPIRSVR